MSQQDDSSKTELPSAKRLRDARKKGDVAKSPDIGITIGFFFALLLVWLVFEQLVYDVMSLTTHALESPGLSFIGQLHALGSESVDVLLGVTTVVVVPLALFGVAVEFLVVGPVATTEKFKPKMSNLNPVEGLKRMFGPDNLVDLFKSIVKTVILVVIAVFAIRSVMGDLMLLPHTGPEDVISGIWYLSVRIFGWASAFYFLLMFVDTGYQNYAFTKRMKMSIRDVRDEFKEVEGDPLLKGARRDLGNEWSQQSPTQAARDATVIVVNPTHVAIAILYDAEKTQLPVITARGEESTARDMRSAAAHAGVPVLRNVELARALLVCEAVDNFVPKEFFNIVAEVILWAQSTREKLRSKEFESGETSNISPLGEDLTAYGVSTTASSFIQ